MRKLVLLFLIAGCEHHNSGPGFQPDMSAIADQGPNVLDDLAGLEAAICATQTQAAQQIGVDILFALDTSYSEDFNLKWVSTSQALKLFLSNPQANGLGVGIQYFPIRQTCDVGDYATPAVPIDILPSAAPTLIASIDAQRMAGGTPMVPAMEGILQYATQHAALASPRRTVVVLATDGVPDQSCVATDGGYANTISSVVQLVQAAANADPPVPTYVIGVGNDLTALNAIAAAGGGEPTAFLVDTQSNVEQVFLQALDSIRKKALGCDFNIPPSQPGETIDFTKVNVQFTEEKSSQSFVYVTDHAGCSKAPNNGWYFDDEMNPTKVILCDQACDTVRSAETGQINIVFGCATIIP